MTLEDLIDQKGQRIAISAWRRISDADVDQFSELTQDFQFAHHDRERDPADTPYGMRIIHGFFLLSLIAGHFKDHVPQILSHRGVINYGLEKVRFIHPVRAGSDLRSEIVLQDVQIKPENRALLHLDFTLEIKDVSKPALRAVWLAMLVPS
ncbi:MAG: MaoC/PaaZ C-terminal domain-containing protein [Pseudomonadota bacterium]